MENKNISQIVLERIKGEGLKPISRSVFSIKRVLFWTAVTISLIIGAFVFSLILSGLFNNDWDLYNKFGFNFILKTFPYFWLGSLIIFVILGEYYYRKTLHGYRHTLIVVVGAYMASSIIFGSLFYVLRVGEVIEKSLVDVPLVYRNIILNRHEVWTHPEEGLLSGKITKIGDGEIEMIDSNGNLWIIDTTSSTNRGKVEIEVGERIKILGDIIDENNFIADEIRPWVGVR
ncbi:hypothetical protein HXX01_04520 [Candidatus Nomurabacteria bacterium]|nr:hypothetical protein [Candidatus Nomurabacteria bacterium]